MTETRVAVDNPYWDAVKDHVRPSYKSHWGPECADLLEVEWSNRGVNRQDMTSRFAWTVSDPESVQFVLDHCGPRVLDPLAGTGYWAWLLTQAGVDVEASDLDPPRLGNNKYHRDGNEWVEIAQGDAFTWSWTADRDQTLLLSWPPYDSDLGERVARAFSGRRLIYIGESEYCSCGTDAMFGYFTSAFELTATRIPVQWSGMHDEIRVYDRRGV